MLGLVIGVFAILLGLKAFSPAGIPFTKDKNLTGTTAKVIGVVCILIGIGFLFLGVVGTIGMMNHLNG